VPCCLRISGALIKTRMSPPARAADVKVIAMYSSPLPRKTVAKKRSSSAPRRLRTTAINHKKAMPANGIRFKASEIGLEWLIRARSCASGFAGIETQMRR